MKSLYEIILETILDSTKSGKEYLYDDKKINKWLKQHGCRGLKARDKKIRLWKGNYNELNLFPGEENVPEFIVFDENWPTNSSLCIKGPSLKTIRWAPVVTDYGKLIIDGCNELEDFDLDCTNYSKNAGHSLEIKNCEKLKSFSGLKKAKNISLELYNLKSLTSLKQITDGTNGRIRMYEIENCPIKNLEGYVCDLYYGSYDYLKNLPNFESYDGAVWPKDEYKLGAENCPKLHTLGNADFSKTKGINFIKFHDCPKIDRNFVKELIQKVKFAEQNGPNIGGSSVYGDIKFVNTGIDKNKDIDVLKELHKVSNGLPITVNDDEICSEGL